MFDRHPRSLPPLWWVNWFRAYSEPQQAWPAWPPPLVFHGAVWITTPSFHAGIFVIFSGYQWISVGRAMRFQRFLSCFGTVRKWWLLFDRWPSLLSRHRPGWSIANYGMRWALDAALRGRTGRCSKDVTPHQRFPKVRQVIVALSHKLVDKPIHMYIV